MISEYLNLIQLISGVLAAVLVFLGIFITCRKLNPEKYETIPYKTTVISTALIIAGLLCYGLMKTCTNYTVATEEQYELWSLYLASMGEVVKSLGFIAFIPLLFRLFKPKSRKEKPEEEITEDGEES
ncbi:MAG: hypothetical protein IJK83_12270 [Clostridiales bacterium]|nr:hypothetical protein [Clostridiales bacterium]MBR2820986.1 hypothetical protein [Clostridiales bacterium]